MTETALSGTLADAMVRVTEKAAIAAFALVGRGDEKAADAAGDMSGDLMDKASDMAEKAKDMAEDAVEQVKDSELLDKAEGMPT